MIMELFKYVYYWFFAKTSSDVKMWMKFEFPFYIIKIL